MAGHNRRDFMRLLAASGLSMAMPSALAAEEAPLILKPIPSSGERLPVIGLGTSRVFEVGPGDFEREGPKEVLRTLAGVSNSMMDTSPMYGSAETVVGDLAAELGVRDRLFFATKVWTRGREQGIAQMQESMRRLRTERLDLIQVHNLVDTATHLRTLRDWKKEGRVRYVGITHYHAGAHEGLMDVMQHEPLDFVQVNYSLLEPEAQNRLLPLAQEKGIAIIVNRPFARGQLFRITSGKPLPPWAAELGIASWAQYFLTFVVSHPAVTVAIPGTSKARHMRDNQMAGRGILPDTGTRERMFRYMQSL
jgi:aryl-alcohol dehydrogenase-like predicted oxidoreductase